MPFSSSVRKSGATATSDRHRKQCSKMRENKPENNAIYKRSLEKLII